jgi:3-deoxy-D-manno-octulosonic-acid transferase
MNAIAFALYTAALHLLIPVALLHLWWRGRRQPEYLEHVAERFGGRLPAVTGPVLWIHAVSVGETRAAQPLVRALQADYPGHRIVMTHTTPTGRATGEALFGDSVTRVYLPYDLPWAVARLLDRYRPDCGVLMETELWPNLVRACVRRAIPVHLVNARLSEKSARGYRRLARLIRITLGSLAGIAAQSAQDAQRLRALGAVDVVVTGSMKFDMTPPADAVAQGQAMRRRFGADRPVVLAASTREGEETLLLPWLERLSPANTLVPRHPQRFDEVAQLLATAGVRFQRRSEQAEVSSDTRVLLGDSMGEMFAYYGAADVAFVGGSLLPLGGQNLIEACAMGTPVVVGPHMFNFQEITAQACAAGAVLQVADAAGVVNAFASLLNSPDERRRMSAAGRDFATTHRGASARAMAMLRDQSPRLR